MPHVFFIADTHFGSERLRRYENRPFPDTETMDRALVENWNRRVSAEDTIWHLGDFGAEGREAEIIRQLNGRICLVKGNHDSESSEYYRRCGFSEVYDHPVILESFWILSHEPMYVNENMPYANIFGHVHASPIFRDFSSQHMCVCVERIGYAPVKFAELKKRCGRQADTEPRK